MSVPLNGAMNRYEAQAIADKLHEFFPDVDLRVNQVICLAEEVGEFVKEARRYLGMARRNGNFDDMAAELADVVITAYVTATVLDVNLDNEIAKKLAEIWGRGWRESGISPEAS